jgi:hypothetical protein
MKKHYLTLADGREVRVEWNMNSAGEFTKLTGKELSELNPASVDIATLKTIALCAIREGEDSDGRKFEADEKTLGKLMGMPQIIKFAQILNEQSDTGEQKKSEPPNKLKQIFFRKGPRI